MIIINNSNNNNNNSSKRFRIDMDSRQYVIKWIDTYLENKCNINNNNNNIDMNLKWYLLIHVSSKTK